MAFAPKTTEKETATEVNGDGGTASIKPATEPKLTP